MTTFVLAHLSDPHLAPLPRPSLGELAGKRAIGYLNWHRGRFAVHRSDVLARIVADLKQAAPDHIAVTGDLVNIALAKEYAPALTFLAALGGARDVTLVPGNHDAYVPDAVAWPHDLWGPYMCGDADEGFPFVRRRGPLALIGLSTALPTGPFMATGKLGEDQLAGLATALAAAARERRFRVVMIHHPASRKPSAWHKRLVDAPRLREVLARHGAELVIHGHEHVRALEYLDGPAGRIPMVGVPSASANPRSRDEPAGYNLYRITDEAGAWRCEIVSRGLAPGGDGVVETGRMTAHAG